jgi:hypothetical protein
MLLFARKIIGKRMDLAKNSINPDVLDKVRIISELDSSTKSITDKVTGLSNEKFNFRKEKGAWSIGDCLEHLVITEQSAKNILLGPVKYYNRDYDAKLSVVKKAFGDDTKKFAASILLLPSESSKIPEKMINDYIANREDIKKVVEKEDLTVLCDAFRHKLFGHFTRLEWIYFVIYHSERHARQIERIISSLP